MDMEKPLPSDCCGSGCTPCVFDIYEDHLQSIKNNQETLNHFEEHLLRTDLLSKTRFKPFTLIEKHKLTEDVYLLRFQAVENIKTERNEISEVIGTLPYNVGQHLFLRCCLKQPAESNIDDDNDQNNQLMPGPIEGLAKKKPGYGKIPIRAFTPITIAKIEKNCCFNVFAKIYKNGTASNILSQSLVGDTLYWRGPSGTFNFKPNSFDHVLITCIGTGLAPMVPIINTILNNEFDETLVHLMFGVKNMNRIILRDELRKMTHYWNFTLEYYLSQSTKLKENAKFGENVKDRKIDMISIAEYIDGKKVENVLVLVCGTESFSLGLKNVLFKLGFDLNENVHIFS